MSELAAGTKLPPRATNIFQLEFHVNDLQLWQSPNDDSCIDSDPIGIEFRYLDSVRVRIDPEECGTGTGQNCMFTLDTQPTSDDGPISIVVFKRPLCPAGEQISIGSGEIVIDAAFEKIYREIGEDAVAAFPKSDVYKAWYPLLRMHQPVAVEDDVDAVEVAAVLAAIASEEATNAVEAVEPTDVVDMPDPVAVHVGVVCVRLRLTCFGPYICMPSAPLKALKCKTKTQQLKEKKQTDGHIACDEIFKCVCPATLCPPIGRRKRRRPNHQQKRKPIQERTNDICSDSICSNSSTIDCEPFTDSELIINKDTLLCGCKTSGSEEQDPFHPPAVPPVSKTDILPQTPDSASYGRPKHRRRPVAVDEYRTEFDENTLIVRVAKNARKVCRLVDGGAGDIEAMQLAPPGPNEMPICVADTHTFGGLDLNGDLNRKRRPESPCRYRMTCTQDGNNMNFQVPNANRQFKFINTFGLPIIRGNRKYPAGFETNFRLPDSPVVDEPIADGEQLADVAVAEGIEVSKRPNCDPRFDVFVLKLAPLSSCADDYVELELHTPKSPTVRPQCMPNEAQTVEGEFAMAYSADGNKLGAGRGAKGEKRKTKENIKNK